MSQQKRALIGQRWDTLSIKKYTKTTDLNTLKYKPQVNNDT